MLAGAAMVAAPAILLARDALAQTYRTTLLGSTTYYIDLYGGSDANNGSAGSPWRTLNYAWSWCQNNLDLNGQRLTFQIAETLGNPGLVPGLSVVEKMVGQVDYPIFNGLDWNPWGVVIHCQSHCITGFRDATFGVNNLTVMCEDDGAVGILAVWGSKITIQNCFFAKCGFAHMQATKDGWIFANGPYQIWKGAANHIVAGVGRAFITGGDAAEVQVWGNPTFSNAFAFATEPTSYIGSHTMKFVNGGTNTPATVSGYRHKGTRGGSIVCGNDPNYFPGSLPGFVDPPGVFS
jgi:hypothetical protein